MVSVSPYVPALGSEVEKKIQLQLWLQKKNHKHGCVHGDNMAVYGKCEVVFLEK
jgi:hypothetical protein